MTTTTLPSWLGSRARAWAERVLAEAGDAVSDTDLRLIILAAEAHDRASTARRQLAREGITYTDRFGAPRAHPAVAIERDSRAAFSRLVAQLGLDDTDPDGIETYRANGRTYTRRKGS